MNPFSEIMLDPGGIVSWLVVGLVAGLLANFTFRGGYGLIGDVLVGLIGAVVSGFVYELFAAGTTAFWRSTIVAFLGASILIGAVRTVAYARTGT